MSQLKVQLEQAEQRARTAALGTDAARPETLLVARIVAAIASCRLTAQLVEVVVPKIIVLDAET
jgi:hypothetical protein